eukprot:TRINITY_DN2355_c0_g1_i1.p1 TRINITY_DN2355_c0_g1~~TRINITY_DN2355_c0_g1_i1.p1  ORF type:complete len:512 (+),score=198.45 TRINITY_DN2355_c0_g1_i1:68-1537(+)
MDLENGEITILNFIDGKYQEKPLNGEWMDNFNPATGKPYGKLPNSGVEDVELAVQSARNAFKSWSKTPKDVRSRILNKIADILESRLEEFAKAESRDQGKPVSLARTVDIPRVISNFRFFAGAILHHVETSSDMDGVAVNYTTRSPIGVCGLISPWNLPLYLLTWKIAPALAVGNTIVCKPSEFTSLTAFMLCSVMKEAGLPDGVCNMVFGRGVVSGNALVEHPKVPLISFTGGTHTGQFIIRNSAPHYKKLYLELGGKNPNIIFDDANLEECVATTVRSSFSNQGEICLCGSRILVQEGIYDKFIQRFVEETKKLVVGDPRDPKTTTGALVSDEHLKRVMSYVQIAKDEGGVILTGGDQPKMEGELEHGYFLNPTIISNLHPDGRVQQEEIFGPVVGVSKFKTEEEAIEIANNSKYGLASIVWTEDLRRAHRVANEIEAGTVWVNCWMVRDLKMPFGGHKWSGLGRASGEHSIDLYTEQKTVCIKFQK